MFVTKIADTGGDDYTVHQNIRGVFPGNQRILFQRDKDRKIIVIISEFCPTEDIGDVKEITLTDDQYLFTIRLNSSIRKRDSGKRVPVNSSDLRDWVTGKLSNIGIELVPEALKIQEEGCRRSKKGGHNITISSVLVSGVLNVTDKNLFLSACKKGIGSAKGLGFGMINIF